LLRGGASFQATENKELRTYVSENKELMAAFLSANMERLHPAFAGAAF
jgi:hypothetical protein